MTAGRHPLPRGVHCIANCKLPSEVAVDTSFVIAALNQGEPHHQEAADFMTRLVDGQSLLIHNRLMEIEFVEVAFKLAVKERHGSKGWPAKRSDGRVRRRAGRLTSDMLSSWKEIKSTTPNLQIELAEVADEVPGIMRKWGLASYDAVHAASAIYGAGGSLVTFDAGFGSVPEKDLQVYIERSRVRSCRIRRGGRLNGP
ncbi:type II toxin-antitoxin system VapC family toxin [Intrasporangium chromatireducens]|uniref:type II toxin-antitoxin system VapC family toxin n=1 Tax=Intrasporangium chromatireducens TaxID=1386088 RepID=UPI00196A18B8|nr:type II toxin-antitoxin system VapC family toxin [Intrasporangium chromatireducens]